MMRGMCGMQLKVLKIANDFMLGLNETLDKLILASSVHWYGHVLRCENVLRRALDFEVEGQGKKGRLVRTWMKQVEEESVRFFEQGRCTLLIEVDCWQQCDYYVVEVNLATLTCWGYYWLLGIFLSSADIVWPVALHNERGTVELLLEFCNTLDDS